MTAREIHTMLNFIKDVLNNQPSDWLNLTTHRLDIYNESLAKVEFIDQFETLAKSNNIGAISAIIASWVGKLNCCCSIVLIYTTNVRLHVHNGKNIVSVVTIVRGYSSTN